MSLRGLKFNFTHWNSDKCSWCISIVMQDQFWDLRWSVSCQPCDISESLTVSWFVRQASLNAGVEGSVWGFMIARFNSEWRVNHSKAGQQKATNPMFLYADRVMQDAQSLRLKRWPIHTSTRPMWYGLVEALAIFSAVDVCAAFLHPQYFLCYTFCIPFSSESCAPYFPSSYEYS